jgi:LacI family transcriptional regulator
VVWAKTYSAEAGMYGMRELLLRGRDFSAVFAATDELAIGAIRALEDEGIRVPEDVSVLGFDDIDISSYIVPRLTTIRQPLADMGERTATLMHKSITRERIADLDVVLPYELIIRESTSRV